MTKRTRLFLAISGGILVVGLGTGLVASYMGLQNFVLIGSDGPDELSYVPSDAQMVAYANVREIMDSELRQKLHQLQPRSDQGLARFESETGVNVERDVDYVLASSSGGAADHQGSPMFLVRGRFDAVRIEGFVRSNGGMVEDYKGTRLFIQSSPDKPGAVGFLEPGLVAVGTAESLRRAIDLKGGAGQNITSNAELMRLVREADDGNTWAVARFDAFAAGGRVPAEVAKRLPAITWLTATGHVNGGLKAALHAETRDENAARDLREVLQGMLALARLQAGQRAELADVMNSVELAGQGKTVSLTFSLPTAAIDFLSGLHQRGAAPAPGDAPPAP